MAERYHLNTPPEAYCYTERRTHEENTQTKKKKSKK